MACRVLLAESTCALLLDGAGEDGADLLWAMVSMTP